ncbi:hypothetical protein [Tenacibaculum sp. 190524A02b]
MKTLFLILSLITTQIIISQSTQKRSIALFDLSIRNNEYNDGKLFSAEHILKITGVNYLITDDIQKAMEYAIIFFSCNLNKKSLTTEEKNLLRNYVSKGGILIAPYIMDPELFSLFGISNYQESKTNFCISFLKDPSSSCYDWLDEDYEKQISFSRKKDSPIFKTLSFKLNTAIPLGYYSNGKVAVFKNSYEEGYTYSFGFSWKDVILRNQLNRDYEAQRISGNGFEPTSDVIMLLIRSFACQHTPNLLWKHTSSGNSSSTLMITHDLDSSSAMDTLAFFTNYEKKMKISATYNVTVRYFSDALNSDFYNDRDSEINGILNQGHVIGSHSVGHFPDFANATIFPMGESGNTKESYNPYNDGTKTTGGNVFAECEISKNILEADFQQSINIFRSGHLAYPDKLVNVLEALNYEYNSSNSANDVLTHFPYQNKKDRKFSGITSNVYELPVTVSDVFKEVPINENNYTDKVNTWLRVIEKTNANGAPTVVLIHPNRKYKLDAQKLLISYLPKEIHFQEMSDFGAYWKAREQVKINSYIKYNIANITISNANLASDKNISFIIKNGQELDGIIIEDTEGNQLDYFYEDWHKNDLIVYKKNVTKTLLAKQYEDKKAITVYFNKLLKEVHIKTKSQAITKIQLINILDNTSYTFTEKHSAKNLQNIVLSISSHKIKSGIYICKVVTKENSTYTKKIVIP